MNYKNDRRKLPSILLSIIIFAVSVAAQATAFNYQGKLTDTGMPRAIYQMEFKPFGSAVFRQVIM